MHRSRFITSGGHQWPLPGMICVGCAFGPGRWGGGCIGHQWQSGIDTIRHHSQAQISHRLQHRDTTTHTHAPPPLSPRHGNTLRTGARRVFRADREFREPKVAHLGGKASGDQHVEALEVTVDNLRPRETERKGNDVLAIRMTGNGIPTRPPHTREEKKKKKKKL